MGRVDLLSYPLPSPPVIVSKGYHNKLPHTQWLKTKQIHCLTILEARSLKSISWSPN